MAMRRLLALITSLFPFRVSLIRGELPPVGVRPQIHRARRRTWRAPVVAAAASAFAIAVATALPASADSSGSSTATVNIAVRSITVSPGTTTFDTCVNNTDQSTGSALTFPNGICQTSSANQVTITNGTNPGHIDVQGSDAIPSDNGTHWTLCGGTGGPTCTGSSGGFCGPSHLLGGQDQFQECDVSGSDSLSPILTTAPQCDTGFAAACAASAGQSQVEILGMDGPTASTDTSTSFTTVWTWTAVP
jgi:hypothetical protein